MEEDASFYKKNANFFPRKLFLRRSLGAMPHIVPASGLPLLGLFPDIRSQREGSAVRKAAFFLRLYYGL